MYNNHLSIGGLFMIDIDDIKEWLNIGIALKSTHVVVFCDQFAGTFYPEYVSKDDDVSTYVDDPDSMQKVMEVYDLSKPLEPQLAQFRAGME